MALTDEQIAEIWHRRYLRAKRWLWPDGTLAPDYPLIGSVEDETEETLSLMPPAPPEQMLRQRRKQDEQRIEHAE